jgi:hypothetical protein
MFVKNWIRFFISLNPYVTQLAFQFKKISTLPNLNLYWNMVFYFGVDDSKIWKLYSKYRKKCLRVIKGVNYRVSCRSIFGELKILTVVTSLYIFEILCFIIKNRIYTTQYSDIQSCNTIHKYNLYVQLCNTDHCKKSIINMWIKIFNCLHLKLKSIENFKVFKKKLKNYLICNEFYSLHEFFNQRDWWLACFCFLFGLTHFLSFVFL